MFIMALLDKAEADLCVDTHREFATGFSNGGFMSHRLACELSSRVAAIASVSGVIGIDTCTPSRPMPVLQIHGTSDNIVPYDGGGIGTNYKSVATTIDGWTQRNGCGASTQTAFDMGDATCAVHQGCMAGADVELCTIDGGGHQWPGGESSGIFNGKVSTDLDATDTIWAFFVAHPH
jgi:polyhydroxybutyrate depolymerase